MTCFGFRSIILVAATLILIILKPIIDQTHIRRIVMLSVNKTRVQTRTDTSHYDEDKSFTGRGSSGDNIDSSPGSSVTSGDVESGTGTVRTKDIRDTIIKKEEKAVINARRLVGFAVITCAVAVSVSLYVFTKRSDKKSFELQVSYWREPMCREPHQVNYVSTNASYVVGLPSTKGS
jgi:hypothetical protein